MSLYKDHIYIALRDGTNDPYVDLSEQYVVVNGVVVLDEIPDDFSRVTIEGFVESRSPVLSVGQFYVDYRTGIIKFHQDDEGATVVAVYKGKGVIKFPAERIYTRSTNADGLLMTIQDIISNHEEAIELEASLSSMVDSFNLAKSDTGAATLLALDSADSANAAATSANQAALEAMQSLQEYTASIDAKLTEMDDAISASDVAKLDAETATANANAATTGANTARDQAIQAASGADVATANANQTAADLNVVLTKLRPKGTWDSATTYEKNNFVRHEGSGWMSLADANTGNTPIEGSAHWSKINDRGIQGIQGIQGEKGDKGDGFEFKDTYVPTTQYYVRDLVYLDGSTYICVAESIGESPDSSAKWSPVARKGADGAVVGVSAGSPMVVVGGSVENPTIDINAGLVATLEGGALPDSQSPLIVRRMKVLSLIGF